MTDVEKTLEMLSQLAEVEKNKRQIQLRQSSVLIKELYDSYIEAGFGVNEALELTKTMLATAVIKGLS